MMKTVQDYLREADRERLLDAVAYEAICDPLLLLEYPDKTISEIQDACREVMGGFIDHLLSLEMVPSDHKVLYMTIATSFDRKYNKEDRTLCLIDLDEIRKDIYAPSYAFEFTDWTKTLGYLVADNKLTQDYVIDLLAQFLHEISFFGTDPEAHRQRIEEAYASLDRAMEDIESGNTIPADTVIKELSEKFGLPVDEKDEKLDRIHREIVEAEIKYNRYCNWRERSRILESLGEAAPAFEEEE